MTSIDGRRLSGRLVFDLDKSLTTETLDAPWRGVTYSVPFGLIESISSGNGAENSGVMLRSGQALTLEQDGDQGVQNAGILVFSANGDKPGYLPWREVATVHLESAAE